MWPKYYPNQLITNPDNVDADIGIITGWTKRELVDKNLSESAKKRVAVIGQLYSKEGINYIIRNLALNPKITSLIITGLDLSKSLEVLNGFLKNGINISNFLHKEIPVEIINKFQTFFKDNSHFLLDESNADFSYLNEFIINLPIQKSKWLDDALDFNEPEIQERVDYPSEEVCFRLEDRYVSSLWLKVLDRILKFGREKMSQYGEMQREIINISTIISDEDPDNPIIPEYMCFNKEDLVNYFPQLMTDNVPEGVEYTYGSRLKNHNGINQIQAIVDELKKEHYSRRAVAFTWDVNTDTGNPKSPCLDLVQALVQNNKVYLTAYFRSNDMFRAWPQNCFALRKIQKEIADDLGMKIGKICIISNSAHIYERDYQIACDIIKQNKGATECVFDPRGNFEITIDKVNKLILLNHYSPEGILIQKFSSKSAIEMRNQIFTFVSDTLHAMYIGNEIQKAEIALKQNLDYLQDNELKQEN